jgi:autotransporter-associated beta strand protein
LLKDGNGNGGISIKGGGSLTLENSNITYAGKTRIEAGTMLVVSNSTVSANILSQGIELAGAPVLNTPYTLFKCNDDLNAETDLANVTCDAAIEFDKFIGDDGKSIVVTVTALKSGWWTGSAGDNNLSTAGNWADSIVPTSGNVEIYSPIATTLNVGDTFNANTISIPKTSAVVTIGSGNLQLNTLTNASRLAVASGASLTIEGDMVLTESGTVLHSNEGTVLVKGVVDFLTNSNGNKTYYQYEVVTDATMPIIAGGLAYNGPSNYLTVYLGKDTDSQLAGQWVIGEKGMYYKSSRNIWHTGFMMGQGKTTLYSCADWSLSSSGRANSTRDLGNYYNAGSTVIANSSLVLDTNNYTNNAVSHTITLNGRLISSATTDPAVTIKGAGTVVVNTSEGVGRDGYQKTSIGTTLAVTDTATLKIKAGKSIIGDGKISLGAGTTLALESTASTFTTQNILPVMLPETGTATIRIDGTKLKGGVDYAICTLTDLSDGYKVSDHVTVTGTALDGRKYEVKTDKAVENEKTVTKLVLNIYPVGLIVIVR